MTETGRIFPKLKITSVGRPVSITCSSNSPVKWYKSGQKLPQDKNRYSKANVYRISNVTEADSGLYICVGTHQNGDKFEVNSELFVGGKALHVNVETKLNFCYRMKLELAKHDYPAC